ncbi:ankyrin repeat domain-containing protein [Candidatus Babeliales bacterium]|nr:ankyrin repeat domain-containing protein [Candidatus Babeliales bacterium]
MKKYLVTTLVLATLATGLRLVGMEGEVVQRFDFISMLSNSITRITLLEAVQDDSLIKVIENINRLAQVNTKLQKALFDPAMQRVVFRPHLAEDENSGIIKIKWQNLAPSFNKDPDGINYIRTVIEAMREEAKIIRTFLNLQKRYNRKNTPNQEQLTMQEKFTEKLQNLLQEFVDRPILPDYKTPLSIASSKNFVREAKQLVLDLYANVNFFDRFGQPLINACKYENEEIAKLLLENGAKPNVVDKEGNTPLHLAAKNRNLELIKLLMSYEADPTLTNKQSKTPLQVFEDDLDNRGSYAKNKSSWEDDLSPYELSLRESCRFHLNHDRYDHQAPNEELKQKFDSIRKALSCRTQEEYDARQATL